MIRLLRVIALTLSLAGGTIRAPAQPTSPDATVYLFSTFKEGYQDGLRFAYSYDGYHWSNVPGLFLREGHGENILVGS